MRSEDGRCLDCDRREGCRCYWEGAPKSPSPEQLIKDTQEARAKAEIAWLYKEAFKIPEASTFEDPTGRWSFIQQTYPRVDVDNGKTISRERILFNIINEAPHPDDLSITDRDAAIDFADRYHRWYAAAMDEVRAIEDVEDSNG